MFYTVYCLSDSRLDNIIDMKQSETWKVQLVCTGNGMLVSYSFHLAATA